MQEYELQENNSNTTPQYELNSWPGTAGRIEAQLHHARHYVLFFLTSCFALQSAAAEVQQCVCVSLRVCTFGVVCVYL